MNPRNHLSPPHIQHSPGISTSTMQSSEGAPIKPDFEFSVNTFSRRPTQTRIIVAINSTWQSQCEWLLSMCDAVSDATETRYALPDSFSGITGSTDELDALIKQCIKTYLEMHGATASRIGAGPSLDSNRGHASTDKTLSGMTFQETGWSALKSRWFHKEAALRKSSSDPPRRKYSRPPSNIVMQRASASYELSLDEEQSSTLLVVHAPYKLLHEALTLCMVDDWPMPLPKPKGRRPRRQTPTYRRIAPKQIANVRQQDSFNDRARAGGEVSAFDYIKLAQAATTALVSSEPAAREGDALSDWPVQDTAGIEEGIKGEQDEDWTDLLNLDQVFSEAES